MRPISLLTIVSLLGLPLALSAGPLPRAPKVSRAKSVEKPAITRALTRELGRATPNHVKIASWRLMEIKIQGSWALADVTPTAPRDLDSFTVLLHKTRNAWQTVTLGTNLRGSGKQFGVPRALWEKWGL